LRLCWLIVNVIWREQKREEERVCPKWFLIQHRTVRKWGHFGGHTLSALVHCVFFMFSSFAFINGK
jgi:hypothetical protein